jgi:hypothetical protein
LCVEHRSGHLPAQLPQRVACINKPVQLDSEQFPLRSVDGGFWLQRVFPVFVDMVKLNQEKRIGFISAVALESQQQLNDIKAVQKGVHL